MKKLVLMLAWVVVWCGFAAGAQQDETAAPVRVGRLTYFAGAVEVQRADNTGVDEPVMNMPLGEGTRLICGDYGQAEVEFEDGSLVRVTPRSSVSLDALGLVAGMAKTQMTVLGLVYFELRKSPGYAYTVSAGEVAMSPLENAVVRVSAGEGPAVFSVVSGSIWVERGFTATVKAGESLRADAKDDSRYFLAEQVPLESWDAWNEERDRAAANETEKRTIARDGFAGVQGYGWSDLDANGTWYNVPGEGQVWQPDAADESFDPYGYGGWVWQGVGYVWASGYQWGWTPFRCGRWEFYPGFGWGWVPDTRCGRWGSGGGLVLMGRRLPKEYKPILPPTRLPIETHPIVIVRQPNEPRPPMLWGSVKKVGSTTWTPLVRLGSVARTGPALGLSRDYPVSMGTHLAIAGTVPKEEQPTVINPLGTVSAWQRMKGIAPPPLATGPRPTVALPGTPSSPVRTVQQPVRSALPMQAPARTAAPAAPGVTPRPAQPVVVPIYHAPSPAPAPSYRDPAPPPVPASPPQASPARVDTNKPK